MSVELAVLRSASEAAESRVAYLQSMRNRALNVMLLAHDDCVAGMHEEDRKFLNRDSLVEHLLRGLDCAFEQLRDDADETAYQARHAVLDLEIEAEEAVYAARSTQCGIAPAHSNLPHQFQGSASA